MASLLTSFRPTYWVGPIAVITSNPTFPAYKWQFHMVQSPAPGSRDQSCEENFLSFQKIIEAQEQLSKAGD